MTHKHDKLLEIISCCKIERKILQLCKKHVKEFSLPTHFFYLEKFHLKSEKIKKEIFPFSSTIFHFLKFIQIEPVCEYNFNIFLVERKRKHETFFVWYWMKDFMWVWEQKRGKYGERENTFKTIKINKITAKANTKNTSVCSSKRGKSRHFWLQYKSSYQGWDTPLQRYLLKIFYYEILILWNKFNLSSPLLFCIKFFQSALDHEKYKKHENFYILAFEA